MKKKMRLFVMTLLLFIGGTSMSMAYETRHVQVAVGDTFYVSFLGIYDGTQDIYLYIVNYPGMQPFEIHVGKVSAYGWLLVNYENEGDYWFGTYVNNKLVIGLHVILTVFRPGPYRMIGEMKHIVNKNNFKEELVCVQEKSYVWKYKKLILA